MSSRFELCYLVVSDFRYSDTSSAPNRRRVVVFDTVFAPSSLFPYTTKTRLNSVFKRVFWRRWRDSNSRGAFDPYTISSCLMPLTISLYISLLLFVIFKKTYEHFHLLSGYFFCFFLFLVLPAARRHRRRRVVKKIFSSRFASA